MCVRHWEYVFLACNRVIFCGYRSRFNVESIVIFDSCVVVRLGLERTTCGVSRQELDTTLRTPSL